MGDTMADAVFVPALMFGGVVIAVIGVSIAMVAVGASEWVRARRWDTLEPGALAVRAAHFADRLAAVLRRRIGGPLIHVVQMSASGLVRVREHRRDTRGRLTQLPG